MGFSLLLVVGPAPLQSSSAIENDVSSAADQFEEQAERAEHKLKKNPEDAELLLSLTRARINAGNALAEANPETGEVAYSPESRPAAAGGERILVEVPEGDRRTEPRRRPGGRPGAVRPGAERRAPGPKPSSTSAPRRRRSRSSPKPAPASAASARWRSTASTPSTTRAPPRRRRKPKPTPTPSSNAKTSATNSTRSANAPTNSRNSWPKSKKKPRKPAQKANRPSPTRSAKAIRSAAP